MKTYSLIDAKATQALGARLANILQPGDCLALYGDLGAGKTSLVRGLVQSSLGPIEVPSPTYNLVQIYEMPNYTLWHCDLYRLEQPEEIYELGLIEAMPESVTILEWPDRLGPLLPRDALSLSLDFDGSGRKAHVSGWDGREI